MHLRVNLLVLDRTCSSSAACHVHVPSNTVLDVECASLAPRLASAIGRRTSTMGAALVAFALVLAACGGGATLETATEIPKAPRRPDGVVIEPPPAMPAPEDHAQAAGIVALREPLADRDVEDVVRAYIRAFEREDLAALRELLATEASPLGQPGNKQVLVERWNAKLQSNEYGLLAGVEIAKYTQMERSTYDQLGGPGAEPRPPEMRPGDLLVRVPITTPRVGTSQLFGDFLVLLLRREEGRLKIAGQADEAANP